jgi:hypothetical protein
MATCTICRFDTELDDVALGGRTGRCVCLRCSVTLSTSTHGGTR